MGTGIVTTAILLIIGYVAVTRLIGLAFRLVVPVILLLVLAGAGLFSGLGPDWSPAESDRPYDHNRPLPEDGRRLGDVSLRDIAQGAMDAARSLLRGTLALLDRTADPRAPEFERPQAGRAPASRDRFDEEPFDDGPPWDGAPRPRQVY